MSTTARCGERKIQGKTVKSFFERISNMSRDSEKTQGSVYSTRKKERTGHSDMGHGKMSFAATKIKGTFLGRRNINTASFIRNRWTEKNPY